MLKLKVGKLNDEAPHSHECEIPSTRSDLACVVQTSSSTVGEQHMKSSEVLVVEGERATTAWRNAIEEQDFADSLMQVLGYPMQDNGATLQNPESNNIHNTES